MDTEPTRAKALRDLADESFVTNGSDAVLELLRVRRVWVYCTYEEEDIIRIPLAK